jgi:hypothetical protein
MEALAPIASNLLQELIERVDLVIIQPPQIQLNLAQDLHTPRSILQVLVDRAEPDIAAVAKLHVNYAGELSTDGREEIDAIFHTAQLGQNDRLAVELLKLGTVPPEFLSEWVPASHLLEALKSPHLSRRDRIKFLTRLAQEDSVEPRLQVAESLDTPGAVLANLLGDVQLAVRLATQHNPNCPPAEIESIEWQQSIASNWETDLAELASLGKSKWDWIRLQVAQNPSAGAETLSELALDRVYKIQLAVAKNPSTSASGLAKLLEHKETEVRDALVKHQNANTTILLRRLNYDERAILRRENLAVEVLQQIFDRAIDNSDNCENFREIAYYLIGQSNTPESILDYYSKWDFKCPHDSQNRYLSEEEDLFEDETSTDDLELLTDDEFPRIDPKDVRIKEDIYHQGISSWISIAHHPNASATILERLPEHNYLKLDLAVAANPLTPIDLKQQILRKVTPDRLELLSEIPRLDRESLEYIVEKFLNDLSLKDYNINRAIRLRLMGIYLLKQSILPLTTLIVLADRIRQLNERLKKYQCESEDYAILVALANNPQIPMIERNEYLHQLLNDPVGILSLAIDPRTPVEILEQILDQTFDRNTDYRIREKITCNPSTPEYLLKRIFDKRQQGFSAHYMADHRDAPIEFLRIYPTEEFKNTNTPHQRLDTVMEHPKMISSLEGYRWRLEKEEERELIETNQILVRRLDCPYALAQVVKNGDRHVKISAAHNPKTPISILAQLAEDADAVIRSYVSNNPSLPLDLLLELVRDPDEKVRKSASNNPNLPLDSLLELTLDPSVDVRINLVEYRDKRQVAIPIFAKLANDESEKVRVAIAKNPNTPIEILDQLAQDSSLEVCKALTHNLSTPENTLELIGVERGIVNSSNNRTPANALVTAIDRVLQSANYQQAERLKDILKSHTSQIPGEKLAELANHPMSWIRSDVAYHQNTPASALAQLAYDDYRSIFPGIAQNPNASSDTLMLLLQRQKELFPDWNWIYNISAYIVRRKHLSREVLIELAKSESAQIREEAARHSELPQSALEWLVENETNTDVLYQITSRSDLTFEMINRLIQKSNSKAKVEIAYLSNLPPKLLQKLAKDDSVEVRSAIANREDIPLDTLELLVLDRAVEVRQKLAINQNIPISILTKLAVDTELNVRIVMAYSPSTPISLLEQLAADEKIEVRRAVARNSQAPASLKDKLRDILPDSIPRHRSFTLRSLSRVYNSQTDDLPTILGEYSQSDNLFVRLVILRHPLTPIEILERGMRSIEWIDRYSVADNPSTPESIYRQLTQDSNQIVRAVANANSSSNKA